MRTSCIPAVINCNVFVFVQVLGGNGTEMAFIDSSFIEGVDYAIFFSEDAALAYVTRFPIVFL